MCGFVGSINWADEETIKDMNQMIFHRGPDDGGTWFKDEEDYTIALGSRRLSIQDLSKNGHMPMHSKDRTKVLAYNGEVYNFKELRKKLETKGHSFSSDGDTEVVLKMYEEYGKDCVTHFNGMFAFALWDDKKKELFLARDHFGVKPLYYTLQDDKLAFASEMKTFLKLKGFQRKINDEALGQYLTFLWVPDPLTLMDGVKKLEAGHYAVYKEGALSITQYWDLKLPNKEHSFPLNQEEQVSKLKNKLASTIKEQLVSDVPVGAFLSAGLDSSTIVAIMSEYQKRPTHTYTISFDPKHTKGEDTLDDTDVAKRTADQFNCIHKNIVVDPDVAELLPKLIWQMDEPTADPAIITAYLVSKEASKDVKVLLSGAGGDEIFAGYRKYQAHYLAKKYQTIPSFLRKGLVEPLIAGLPAMTNTRFKGKIRLLKKMARSGSMKPCERFIMDSTYQTKELQKKLCNPETYKRLSSYDPRAQHLKCFEKVSHADFLNQMLYLDSKIFMRSLNLNYNDKMSMLASVEVRVPFIDKNLAEWSMSEIAPKFKLTGSSTKDILRRAMKEVLSDEVLEQKKAGFGAPIVSWLANDLDDLVNDCLSKEAVDKRKLFKYKTVQSWLDEHRSGKCDYSFQIWQLITLEIWMRQFLD